MTIQTKIENPAHPTPPLAPRATRAWHRPLDPDAPVLGRIGTLETRLARNIAEIRAAQAVRYEVFMREMAASPGPVGRMLGRDRDRWDAVCDHLLVIETAGASEKIVGTYRFLRSAQVQASGVPFYTAGEFEIGPMLDRHKGLEFMELGRSCVLAPWRTKRTIELLWHGIWALVIARKVDVLFGCASFPGTDIAPLAEQLSFLYHHAAASSQWHAGSANADAVCMNRMESDKVNPKRALRSLPPLIKGYLRLGAKFGPQAVVDHRFGATDVLVILPVASISQRYVGHFGADASRHAAGI